MSQVFEDEHVHQVYEQIAYHFSSTRYKPWPLVEKFLKDLPDGSVGLDVGCGNGKYLAVNPNIFMLGSDRSQTLTRIAAAREPHCAIMADNLALPHPVGRFDFAISIAVIHHLSTSSRRVAAINEVLGALKSHGQHHPHVLRPKALLYVWALEQRGSRRGWDECDDQDVMVPWVLNRRRDDKTKAEPACSSGWHAQKKQTVNQTEDPSNPENSTTFQRYYHLYREGELERDIVAAGGIVLSSGYEKDNWWAIAGRASY